MAEKGYDSAEDDTTVTRGGSRSRSRSRSKERSSQPQALESQQIQKPPEDAPAESQSKEDVRSITGYWVMESKEGPVYTYLWYHPRGDVNFYGQVLELGVHCKGVMYKNGAYSWHKRWPEDDDDMRVSEAIMNAEGTRIKGMYGNSQKVIGKLTLTRIPIEHLVPQRRCVLEAMLASCKDSVLQSDDLPPSLPMPTIAHNFVPKLGFRFALVPPSPLILVSEVFRGSWAHGVGITPGTVLLSINGIEATSMNTKNFMQMPKTRPVTFTWNQLKVNQRSEVFSIEKQAEKPKPDIGICRDKELQASLETFEGRWQVDVKGSKWGEVQISGNGEGTMTPNQPNQPTKPTRVKILGEGTSELPFRINGWTLSEWAPDRRIWLSKPDDRGNSTRAVWTILERPADSTQERRLKSKKKEFWKVIHSDPQEYRDMAEKLRYAKAGTKLVPPAGRTGLPVHLFTRQENLAWKWECEQKPLKEGFFDIDSTLAECDSKPQKRPCFSSESSLSSRHSSHDT